MCKNFEWGVSYPYQTWKCTDKHTWRPPWGCAFNDQINWPGMHRGWLLGASSECTPSSQTCCPQQAAWCILMAQLVAGGLLLNFNLLQFCHIGQWSARAAELAQFSARGLLNKGSAKEMGHEHMPSNLQQQCFWNAVGRVLYGFTKNWEKVQWLKPIHYIYCRQMPFSFGCAYILVAGWFCTTARVDPCI